MIRALRVIWLALLMLITAMLGALTQSSEGAAVLTVCPSDCQFTKIQEAIDAAKEGDIIQVGAGIYQENLLIGKGLTLRGESPDKVIVRPMSSKDPTVIIRDAKEVILTGLTIIGGEATVLLVIASHVKVLTNKITMGKIGIQAFGSSLEEVVIQGNDIQTEGAGALILGLIKTILRDNQILNNATGIVLGGIVWSHIEGNQISTNFDGIVVGSAAEATIVGNQILNNWGDGIRLSDQTRVTISENKISRNRGWGVSLWQRPCYDTAARFGGVVQGSGNEISGNRKGDLCPPDFPWPPGFKKN